MAGYNNGGTITNCYNTGSISGSGNNAYVGGVAGYNNGGTITNCYNTGSISGSGYNNAKVGGVAGNNNGTITNCYYDIYMSGNIDAIGYGNFDNTVKGLTTLQMTGPDAFSEDCMLFVYDTDNGEKSPWIAKPDIINEETGCVYRYYPHLKGFDYKEVTNDDGSIINVQLDSDEIDTDKWPGKVKATINWSTVSTYEYDKTEHPLSIDSIIFNKPELNTENVNYKRYSVSNSKYISIDAYSNEPGNYCVEIKDDAGNITDVLYYTILNETDYNVIYYVKDSNNGNWNKVQNVINAGTYKAVIEEIPNIEKEFTITPKSITVTANTASKTYGEEDPTELRYEVNGLIEGDSLTGALSRSIGDNVGSYNISLNTLKNDNYNITFIGASFTIDPKPLGYEAVSLSETEFTYNGTAYTPDVTVLDGTNAVSSNEYTVTITDNINAGTAYVAVKNVENGNYTIDVTKTFNINKKQAGIADSPKAISDLKYNGFEQSLITAGTAEDSCVILHTLGTDATTAPAADDENAADADKKWSTNIPVGTDAGTYYVWYKVAEDKNHIGTDASCITVTINKADVTVKADDITITYGEAIPTLSAKVNGLVEADKDKQNLINYTISRAEGTDVGTYTPGTYTITTSTESVFTITLSNDTYTYDGTEKTPEVTVTVGNTEIPASEYKVTITDNINAGTATATVSDVAGGNYDVNGTATFNIKKADISPVLSINGWKEGEEAKNPSVTGNTDNGAIAYTYKLKDADESAYVSTVPALAGTYTLKAEIAPTDNYNGAVVTADFVIEKKAEPEPQHEPEPEPEPEPQPQPVVNTPVNTEPTLPYTTNNTVTNDDGSKTTTDTTYNADYSITKKSVREWKNGKKTTNITLTDKDNKELINVSQVVETGKSGTKKVTTNIIEANGYHYYNELKTAKSGKQTNITDITNADKSSSYVKMITYPDEKVVRNSIDTTSKGISTIAIGTYATGTSTGTSGSTKKNNTDIATSIGFIGTFNAVGTKVDAKTIESVEKLIVNSFEFTDNTLSDTDVVETEMIYKATSRNTAKLIKCKTIDSEITVPSKVIINGKSYKVYAVAENAFKGCDSLTKVILGKTITTIGVKAFADLESLSEIVFNSKSKDGIKIGKGAFNGISEEAQFYMNASKAARDKTANRIKKSGYGNDVVILKK